MARARVGDGGDARRAGTVAADLPRLRAAADAARFDFNLPWMPSLGINLHLAVDGFNIYLLLLAALLFPVVLACTWNYAARAAGRCISR